MPATISDKELKSVENAVREAEKLTSGEIVPFIVKRSKSYPVAYWRAGAIFAIAGFLIVLLFSLFYTGWSLAWLFDPSGSGLIVLLSAVLGVVLTRTVQPLERIFAGSSAMIDAVRDRSMRAFVDEEVFNTRERTGILIFISLFERRVEVVGDSGINAHVKSEEWAHVVEDILLGIKAGHTSSGLVNAIERCGKLLEAKGVEIRDDDTNELSDSVRFGSE